MNIITKIVLLFFAIANMVQGQEIAAPEIVKVSVDAETGKTNIYWKHNNDSRTQYYLVGKISKSPVDQSISYAFSPESQTIPDGSEIYNYIYIGTEATLNSIGFTVKAVVNDVLSSNIVQTDSTIYLQAVFDSCKGTISFIWNDYNNWRGQLDYFALYISINDDEYHIHKQFGEGITSYEMTKVTANQNLNAYIVAIRNNVRRDSSSSNLVNINTNMARPPNYLFADYTTYKNNGQEIGFSIGPQQGLKSYKLMRGNEIDGIFITIANYTFQEQIVHFDDTDFSEGPYFYKMAGINFCNEVIKESDNIASTIVLNSLFDKNNVLLNWNTYSNYADETIAYTVQRRYGDGGYINIGETNQTTFTDTPADFDNSPENRNISSMVCYKVVAKLNEVNKFGQPAEGYSNEMCHVLPSVIQFDYNAFIPGDIDGNNTFGPKVHISPLQYRFQIINMHGVIVYQSRNPRDTRWDGRINGKRLAPEGAYTYLLVYTDENGKEQVLKGAVAVVYP